jgi:uncharacterized protein (DUF2249 family)
MKPIIFIISTVLITGFTAQSQGLLWAKQLGGPSSDAGYSIITDASGNVYTTGYFSGTVDFDPGSGTANLIAVGLEDVFISKMDAAGNFVWAKQLGGASNEYGRSIALDAGGNVYTTGSFRGVADFDPGPGIVNLSAAGGLDIFISKLDAAGNFVWAKQLGGPAEEDRGNAITVDASGNVYTTGSFKGTFDFDPGAGIANLTADYIDIFISKLNGSGDFVWAKKMGGLATDEAYAITTDATGNVYTTGWFRGWNSDFDPGAGTFILVNGVGDGDVFISKLNTNGDFVWAKKLAATSSNFCYGYGIAVDASGNVVTTGSFKGTADFDPGSGTSNMVAGGLTDGFISKLNATGDFVWAKPLGGCQIDDYGTAIALDAAGNIYTTGVFQFIADFDPGPGVFQLNANGGTDAFICKLTASGNFVWAKKIGSGFDEYGYGIALDVSGNIYTTGYFQGAADFDPELGTFYLNSAGGLDAFIHKMGIALPAPDLTNSQFFSTTQIATSGTIDEVIVVRNLAANPTTGPVTFSITNYAPITGLSATSAIAPSITIGFTPFTLDNANWTYDPLQGTFTSNAGLVIPPGGTRNIGIRITRAAGANGSVTHTATVATGTGGGETQISNNSISNTILKN